MRFSYTIFLIICVLSCKAKSDLTPINTVSPIISKCPQEGSCTLDVYKQKALQAKTDDFGHIYSEIIQGDHYVLKFEYKKNENTNYQDSGYREEVFIELDKNNLEIETTALQNRKLYFARWCYCKGETGFYKINQGKLKTTKMGEDRFQLHLSFKMEEVPQIITEINQTFSIQ